MNAALDPTLLHLAQQLAGCYDNREQAMAEPIWYVSLQAWWRPVPLFQEDSVTLFAEQANILQLDRPYRQRLMRIYAPDGQMRAQFYQFRQPEQVLGAGAQAALVDAIVEAEIICLPHCVLPIQPTATGFMAQPQSGEICRFSFTDKQGMEKQAQVKLGWEVMVGKWLSYDMGINPENGQAIWGAMMGPYQFSKREDYPLV